MESKKVGNKTILPKGSKNPKSKNNKKQEYEILYEKGYRPRKIPIKKELCTHSSFFILILTDN